MEGMRAILETHLPFPKRQGKVRDVYDLGDRLLIVSTDRISAFDWILPTPIPDKGRLLTQLSLFWFEQLGEANHLLDQSLPEQVRRCDPHGDLEGRSMVVRKAEVIPFDCVVRGYLEGSGWRDYLATGRVCDLPLPSGMTQCAKLPEPLFTPATKAASGHDENVGLQTMVEALGADLALELKRRSLEVYRKGSELAAARGIVIADTKLEFGWSDGKLLLIDEVLTPDSSRFWPADLYRPGGPQASFDKQFVREYLMTTSWDRNSPPPPLPAEVVEKTREKYIEAYQRLTGRKWNSSSVSSKR
jgi:phosphoribosylaminoimidazole-succinocarboxamide synthase